ncbi:MAG: anti-sigma factor [Oligoflexia bacterium]|nr:anti-sigma factor [Oligoflexia bacterium]
MKVIIQQMNRFLFAIATTTIVALMITSCNDSQLQKIEGGPEFAAVSGTVKFKTTDNNNTKITLETRCLARPSKVSPDATTYVLWAKPVSTDTPPQNMGAFRVDDDLKGSIETIIPFNEFNLFVTLERDGGTTTPSGAHVLETQILPRQKK